MKILQVVTSLNSGGAEKLVVDTSIEFVNKGHSVDIALLNGEKTPFLEKFLFHIPNANVFAIGSKKSIYNPFKNVFKLKKVFKNYDVVQVHLFPCIYWCALANMLSFNKHLLIYTEHNTTNRRREKPIFKVIDKFFYSSYKKIIAISDAVEHSLKKHLGKKFDDKITKIYNGIDLKEIRDAKIIKREELGFSKNDTLIIQVSSFTPQKDQETLIKSLQFLDSTIKLLLVGDGPTKIEHEKLVEEYNLSEQVHFMGIRKDVPTLLKMSDVVVLSSHYEGLSLSSVEGLASGKPFIASDVPGLTEVVKGYGILFDQGDSSQLAQKINSLMKDKTLYQNTAAICEKRANTFDIKKMVANYLVLYKSFSEA